MSELYVLFAVVFSSNVLIRYAFVSSSADFARSGKTTIKDALLMTVAVLLGAALTRFFDQAILRKLALESIVPFLYVTIVAPLCELLLRVANRYKVLAYAPTFKTRTMYSMSVAGPVFLFAGSSLGWTQLVVASIAAPLGFVMASEVLAAINERVSKERTPVAMRGVPLALVSAGLIALAFMGFDGFLGSFSAR